ncbi:hypothetical protein J6590_026902 [Homalodisca vitripennis]|nr:hypothetical protein J6590_026902 [Homalodisca vitripennis]
MHKRREKGYKHHKNLEQKDSGTFNNDTSFLPQWTYFRWKDENIPILSTPKDHFHGGRMKILIFSRLPKLTSTVEGWTDSYSLGSRSSSSSI